MATIKLNKASGALADWCVNKEIFGAQSVLLTLR